MNFSDLVIPPFVRWAVLAAAVTTVFGAGAKAGMWYSDRENSTAIADAKRETAELRANVSTAAAKQAERAVQAAARQINIVQEVTRDSTSRSRALDGRIAAGGLRFSAFEGGRSACSLPARAGDPRPSADEPTQFVSAGAERDPGSVQGGMEQTLQQAARDAQQLAEVIDAVCKLGVCGPEQGLERLHDPGYVQ